MISILIIIIRGRPTRVSSRHGCDSATRFSSFLSTCSCLHISFLFHICIIYIYIYISSLSLSLYMCVYISIYLSIYLYIYEYRYEHTTYVSWWVLSYAFVLRHPWMHLRLRATESTYRGLYSRDRLLSPLSKNTTLAACVYLCRYACMYACMHVFINQCMYVRMYVCTYVRM